MKSMKRLMAVLVLAAVTSLGAPSVFADGATETPGIAPGATETPGSAINGATETPGYTSDGATETPGLAAIITVILSTLQ
ncbi:MAG TPA: hypothetical protein VF507_05945 [Pyrinomonadaceae bacterium]|jgi:hypothetical protein